MSAQHKALENLVLTPPPSEDKVPASQKSSSSNHSYHEGKSVNYIDSLKEEREQLANFTDGLTHVYSLIDKEIKRASDAEKPIPTSFNVKDGSTTMLSEILPIPVDLYPNYNFVGRILGPRGTTAKQLEATTGCKIIIHGRKKDVDGQPVAEPTEPLSIEISCPANVPGAHQKLEMGASVIKALLVPPADGQDELKRQQLMVLANMNGTYRPRANSSTGSTAPASPQLFNSAGGDYSHQFQNLLPFGYRLPVLANCQHEMVFKSLLSLGLTPSTVNQLAEKQEEVHGKKRADCSNPKCAVFRNLVENNESLSSSLTRNASEPVVTPPPAFNNSAIGFPKMEDVFNMMQWYDLMNRMRLASSTIPADPETLKAQEISNRLCSSIGPFGTGPTPRSPPRRSFTKSRHSGAGDSYSRKQT